MTSILPGFLRSVTLATMLLFHAPSANSATPVLFDANGTAIGVVLDFGSGQSGTFDEQVVSVISPEGFYFAVNGNGERAEILGVGPGTLVYESADCTGQGYLISSGSTTTPIVSGLVVEGPGGLSSDLVYVPRGSSPAVLATESVLGSAGGCTAVSLAPVVYPALPNDPIITGVPDVIAYLAPLELLLLDVVTDCLFQDGFECPLL